MTRAVIILSIGFLVAAAATMHTENNATCDNGDAVGMIQKTSKKVSAHNVADTDKRGGDAADTSPAVVAQGKKWDACHFDGNDSMLENCLFLCGNVLKYACSPDGCKTNAEIESAFPHEYRSYAESEMGHLSSNLECHMNKSLKFQSVCMVFHRNHSSGMKFVVCPDLTKNQLESHGIPFGLLPVVTPGTRDVRGPVGHVQCLNGQCKCHDELCRMHG